MERKTDNEGRADCCYVGGAGAPSHLILCRPLLLLPPIPPSIRVFSNESTLCMRWPKYWSFSLQPKQLPPGTSFFLALRAAWGWRQHRAVRRGPVSDRSLLSEGTGQVGRPCLDQVSSPVCSSLNLARQDLQPLAVSKPVAGLRVRRGGGTGHREAALRPRWGRTGGGCPHSGETQASP